MLVETEGEVGDAAFNVRFGKRRLSLTRVSTSTATHSKAASPLRAFAHSPNHLGAQSQTTSQVPEAIKSFYLGSLGSDTIENANENRIIVEIHKVVELLWNDPVNREKLTVRYVRDLVEANPQLLPGSLSCGAWEQQCKELIKTRAV